MANVDPIRPFEPYTTVNYIEPKPNLHTELDTLLPFLPFTNSPPRNSCVAEILFRAPEIPMCPAAFFSNARTSLITDIWKFRDFGVIGKHIVNCKLSCKRKKFSHIQDYHKFLVLKFFYNFSLIFNNILKFFVFYIFWFRNHQIFY